MYDEPGLQAQFAIRRMFNAILFGEHKNCRRIPMESADLQNSGFANSRPLRKQPRQLPRLSVRKPNYFSSEKYLMVRTI